MKTLVVGLSIATRSPGSAKAQDTLSVLEDVLRRGKLELSGASPSCRPEYRD